MLSIMLLYIKRRKKSIAILCFGGKILLKILKIISKYDIIVIRIYIYQLMEVLLWLKYMLTSLLK